MSIHDTPVFGERAPNAAYVRRPSAYAVIRHDDGRVAVVRTPQGVFLPGGGLEPGETAEQAVRREVLEECGFAIRITSRLPDAMQLVYSEAEQTYFEKPSAFFAAAIDGHNTRFPDAGHEVLWIPSDTAASLVAHESHCWALESNAR